MLRCNLPYRQARPFGPPGPGDAARDRAGLKNAVAAIKKTLGSVDRAGAPSEGAPSLSRPPLAGQGGDFDFQSNSDVLDPRKSEAVRLFLGGHSYGGRQASMLCAEEPDLVAALLLLSYPLHPPRKPEQQRTQHLPDLRTPTLFVQGTRDPFASIEELQRAIKMIPARTKLLPVEGAGHDLGFKGRAMRPEEIPRRIFSEFTKFSELSS